MNDRRLTQSPFCRIGHLPRRLLVIAALTIAANELFWRHRLVSVFRSTLDCFA